MQNTTGEERTDSLVTFFYVPLHMNVLMLADQQKLIYIRFVWTKDVV